MGITVSKDSIRVSLDQWSDEIEEQIIRILTRVGEEFVKAARSQPQSHAQGTYVDDTTALRNSVCYFLFKNGELIKSKTDIAKSGSGAQKGIEAAKRIAQQYADFIGYRLLGVAGMNYASHVESKGYNVISVQQELAFINLKEYFDAIE